MNSHEAIQAAIAMIWDELPALIGAEWPELEDALLALLRELDKAAVEDDTAVNQIIELIGRHPDARKRLVDSMGQVVGRQFRGAASDVFEKRERFTVVPVYYATDREATGDPNPDRYYGGGRGPMTFGIAEVTVPDDHRMGELRKPSWWRLEFHVDPERHVRVASICPLDRAGFTERVRSLMETLARLEALVFVHGYNVSFADAACRTAQIAYDLHFGGIPMLYTWPSAAKVFKYTVDETNIRWTQQHFLDFMKTCLSQLGARTIHVIAHSMGSRVVTETLSMVERELPEGSARLREIILAAPDIDAETFRNLAAEFPMGDRRVTLYASSKDRALRISKRAHGNPRAGESGDGLVIAANVDTIDASRVDTSLIGHSYYGDNSSILADMFHLILNGHPPDRRFGLRPEEKGGQRYWQFQQ